MVDGFPDPVVESGRGERPQGEDSAAGSNASMRRTRWGALICCGLLAAMEGFDSQVMAFAAPEIEKLWSVPKANFGPVFSAGLIGGIVGGFLYGSAAERCGPKKALLLFTLVFSIFTLATAFAKNIDQLILLRGIAGVGIGGAVPGVIVVISRLTAESLRATMITSILCAALVGASASGLLVVTVAPAYGWQAAFYIGGAMPFLIMPFFMAMVPELPHPVENRSQPTGGGLPERARGARPKSSKIWMLFRSDLLAATARLWLTAMCASAFYYLLASWMPSILTLSGMTTHQAVGAGVSFNISGVFGAVLLGRLMDRYDPYRVVTISYVIGGCATLALSVLEMPLAGMFALTMISGFFTIGALFCGTALPIIFYPSELHSVGVGTFGSLGRAGGTIGPLIGSGILLAGGDMQGIFLAAAIISGIAAFCVRGLAGTAPSLDKGE